MTYRFHGMLLSTEPSQPSEENWALEMSSFHHARAPWRFLSMVLAAVCLVQFSAAHAQSETLQQQVAQHQQKLAEARGANNQTNEAAELGAIGLLYSGAGHNQEALNSFTQALTIERAIHERNAEPRTLIQIGLIYRHWEQQQKALDSFQEALTVSRDVHVRGDEGRALSGIGAVYSDLGKKEVALDYFNKALSICRDASDRSCELDTLDHMGWAYDVLGQKPKALAYYSQALSICREAHDHELEAAVLNNIAWVYQSQGKDSKALKYLKEALPISRQVHSPSRIADILGSMGTVYGHLGQARNELEYSNQSLLMDRELGDRDGQAYALWEIGQAESRLGNRGSSLRNELAALALAKAATDPDLEGNIDTTLMLSFRDRKRLDEAVFFGKDAVNCFQQMRRNIAGLDKDVQAGFAQSKSATYRQLAELLVQTDHLGEAEQVLDLLKEQELNEVVRGAATGPEAATEPVKLTSAQEKAQSDLAIPEETAVALTNLSFEYATLQAKKSRTPEETARMKSLDARIEAGNDEVSNFFEATIVPELKQKSDIVTANQRYKEEKEDVSQLQNTLLELGKRNQRVLGIRLLLGDAHAYAIVVRAQGRKKFELKATPADLRSKALQVRKDLRTPNSNPKPELAELYAMVVAPLEDELSALEKIPDAPGRVPTLLWSLDGVMRYLPMAALYDGHHYLLERFRNVLFTPQSYGHMTASPDADASGSGLSVLAMGLSRSYHGLPALPGVLPELDAIVHDPDVAESHGPMEGKLLTDDHFTLEALKNELGEEDNFPVVHIASHFVEDTGGGQEPYLMLGGEESGAPTGYALTLSKLNNSTITFLGTRLLTLSACSTARGDATKDGMEMDSLVEVAHQKHAEAVLATLWDVNDASTSRLMSDFYSRWVKSPVEGKAEALRQAQLALLRSSPSESTASGKDRGAQAVENPTAATRATGYSHPYYWAPFVLIGNFQ